MYHSDPPAGTFAEHLVDPCELFLPCDKMLDLTDFGQAEADCKCRARTTETRYVKANSSVTGLAIGCSLLQGRLPSSTLLSASQRRRTSSGAALAMIWRFSDILMYPLSPRDVYLTMLVWSACMTIRSASAWPGTTADARGTTCFLSAATYIAAQRKARTIIEWPRAVGVLYSSNANLVTKSPLIGPY